MLRCTEVGDGEPKMAGDSVTMPLQRSRHTAGRPGVRRTDQRSGGGGEPQWA